VIVGPRVVVVDKIEFLELSAEEAVTKELGGEIVRWRAGDDEARLVVDADIVIAGETEITSPMISGMERCLAIICMGIGFDHVDVDAALEMGIAVVNHPGVWTDEVSTHALALLLGLSRQLVRTDAALRDGTGWMNEAAVTIGAAGTVRGATLGIIGFGRIGRMVARKAQAFGLRLLATDPYIDREVPKEYDARLVPLEVLLRESDFVSVHTPLTKETYHLVGEEQFRLMKPTAMFINTARGRVHDEAALLRALDEGWIAGAGLDVFEVEPTEVSNPLFARPNTIVTPHTAYYSPGAVAGLHERIADAIRDSCAGRLPYNTVNAGITGRSRIESRSR
jgi:D-3-phosphoglycerate dehydrogenase